MFKASEKGSSFHKSKYKSTVFFIAMTTQARLQEEATGVWSNWGLWLKFVSFYLQLYTDLYFSRDDFFQLSRRIPQQFPASQYRGVFNFPYFNIVQSQVFDDVSESLTL